MDDKQATDMTKFTVVPTQFSPASLSKHLKTTFVDPATMRKDLGTDQEVAERFFFEYLPAMSKCATRSELMTLSRGHTVKYGMVSLGCPHDLIESWRDTLPAGSIKRHAMHCLGESLWAGKWGTYVPPGHEEGESTEWSVNVEKYGDTGRQSQTSQVITALSAVLRQMEKRGFPSLMTAPTWSSEVTVR